MRFKIISFLLSFLGILVGATSNCNILALSGGGAYGATEMGIIDSLVSSERIPNTFDVITGISTGGLNAAFLSHFDNISSALPYMYNIFSNLHTKDIYTPHYLGIFNKYSIYDNSPLEKTIGNILQNAPQLPRLLQPLILIGASNVYTERLDIFKYNDLSHDDKINVLMSTSSIPIIFPPRKYNGGLYVDGGVISNQLIYQVIGQINCAFYNITLINARTKDVANNDIISLTSYLGSLVHMILSTFDNQVAQMTTCSNPIGQINVCFPTSHDLAKYSVLNFDNEVALYELGKTNNGCVEYQLC
jgi:predicted patatin/cPLA2 family phospholipase